MTIKEYMPDPCVDATCEDEDEVSYEAWDSNPGDDDEGSDEFEGGTVNRIPLTKGFVRFVMPTRFYGGGEARTIDPSAEILQIASRWVTDYARRHESPTYPVKALVDGEEVSFETVEDKFARLAVIWRKHNAGQSVTEYNHAAYLQIIGMGRDVVPLLLRELQDGKGDWLLALKYITGAKVTGPVVRGNFKAIREAWLQWGQEHGFWRQL